MTLTILRHLHEARPLVKLVSRRAVSVQLTTYVIVYIGTKSEPLITKAPFGGDVLLGTKVRVARQRMPVENQATVPSE
jgi:hypothetical protein